MTTQLDFTWLEKAGVSQTQFGRLVGVSRISVNTWINQGRLPKKPRQRRVSAALNMLREAVERGVLPVTADSQSVTTQRILDAMAPTHLKG